MNASISNNFWYMAFILAALFLAISLTGGG